MDAAKEEHNCARRENAITNASVRGAAVRSFTWCVTTTSQGRWLRKAQRGAHRNNEMHSIRHYMQGMARALTGAHAHARTKEKGKTEAAEQAAKAHML